MRLIKIQSFHIEGDTRYTGVFEAGKGGYALLGTSDWNQFYTYYIDNQAKMQLVEFEVDPVTGMYIGVWRGTSHQHRFVFDLDWRVLRASGPIFPATGSVCIQ